MLELWGDNNALTAREPADCTIPLKDRVTLIEHSVTEVFWSNTAVT